MSCLSSLDSLLSTHDELRCLALFDFPGCGAADLAEKYGDGTVRITVDENVVFTGIKDAHVDDFLAEPLVTKFPANPGETPACIPAGYLRGNDFRVVGSRRISSSSEGFSVELPSHQLSCTPLQVL